MAGGLVGPGPPDRTLKQGPSGDDGGQTRDDTFAVNSDWTLQLRLSHHVHWRTETYVGQGQHDVRRVLPPAATRNLR